ncbi:MAG: rhodanese-like domain-containing protein [Saprospiraceae bacterium]|nr:rhodanese-like domain-containing protein [Saprospiraceae bacterium]
MRSIHILCACFLMAGLWACKGKGQAGSNTAQTQDTVATEPKTTGVTGAGVTEPDSIIVWINNEEFFNLVGDGSKVQLCDVSVPKEFHWLHMGQARNVPFPSDDFDEKIRIFSKNAPVFLYCPSGIRSGDAAKRMKELGYKRIYVLEYGLRSWHKALYRTPPDMVPPEHRRTPPVPTK